jgi:hypothetical protein
MISLFGIFYLYNLLCLYLLPSLCLTENYNEPKNYGITDEDLLTLVLGGCALKGLFHKMTCATLAWSLRPPPPVRAAAGFEFRALLLVAINISFGSYIYLSLKVNN